MTDVTDNNAPKFFVLSICALRQGATGIELAHGNGLIICGSAEEANQKGLEGAQQQWNEVEGWTGHDVVVKEVPRDVLTDALAKLNKAESHDPQTLSSVM
jgi:hypothetical protein